MYGFKFSWEEYKKMVPDEFNDPLDEFDENIYEPVEKQPRICVLVDGMNGEFCIVGHIFGIGDTRNDDDLSMTEIDRRDCEAWNEEIVSFCKAFKINIENKNLKIYAFSFYT